MEMLSDVVAPSSASESCVSREGVTSLATGYIERF